MKTYLKEYGCFFKNKYGNPEKQFTVTKKSKALAEVQAKTFGIVHDMEFMYVIQNKPKKKNGVT